MLAIVSEQFNHESVQLAGQSRRIAPSSAASAASELWCRKTPQDDFRSAALSSGASVLLGSAR